MLVHELPNQQRERDESHAPEGGAFGVNMLVSFGRPAIWQLLLFRVRVSR